MKIKNLLIGALMTVIAAPVMAQAQDPNVAQAEQIIKSKAPDAAKQVNAIYKLVKKDAKAVAGIGRAYLGIKDFENADKYADLAIKADKSKAVGYVLKGDICVLKDDGGAASGWFEQAIYFEPKDPEGYRRYAQINSKTDPAGSIAKLEELRKIDPEYPVDLVAAEIQGRANNLDAAISYYDKVSLDKMENYQLTDYSMYLFLKGNFEKSLKVSSFGNNKFPRYASLNRLTMFNQVNLKNYDEALKYGDRLFNESDSVKVSSVDYQNYGAALLGVKKYDEAIATYQKIIDDASVNDETKAEANKNISDAYKAMGNYAKAGEYYDLYVKGQKNITAYILSNNASIYMAQAGDANTSAEDKAAALAKADAIYAQIAEKFPSVADFAIYQRSHIPFQIDPEDKAGNAKPHYEQLIEVINAKSEKNATDNNRLKESYQYLAVYYLKIANDVPKSKEAAAKLQSIDPENELAKTILGLK